MHISLSSLVPKAEDLLVLEVEEVAGVLLAHLNSLGDDSGDSVIQRGLISQNNFVAALDRSPVYPVCKDDVNQALMEAWSWLQGEGC